MPQSAEVAISTTYTVEALGTAAQNFPYNYQPSSFTGSTAAWDFVEHLYGYLTTTARAQSTKIELAAIRVYRGGRVERRIVARIEVDPGGIDTSLPF